VVERRAIVHSTPEDRKLYTLIQQLNTVRAEKEQKRKDANRQRTEQRQVKLAKEKEKFDPINKVTFFVFDVFFLFCVCELRLISK